jgi:hypothetical protein
MKDRKSTMQQLHQRTALIRHPHRKKIAALAKSEPNRNVDERDHYWRDVKQVFLNEPQHSPKRIEAAAAAAAGERVECKRA